MSWTAMTDVPNPIIVDAAGTAGSGYVLKAYLPGTTTTTSIAIDSSGTSPQSTITANSEGKWEVSGNEIIPFIDRAHKWGVFASAAQATANTPFYMGPFDNVPQGSDATSAASATKDASTITYTPAGAGAVATTVQAKLRWSVSVKDFGAVGDGVTDDTAAVQLALNAMTPFGTLVFPNGEEYKISVTLTLSVNNVTIKGNAKIKAADSTNFLYLFEAINLTGLKIHGLEFDANKTGRAAGQSIRFNGVNVQGNIDCELDITVRNTLGYSGSSAVAVAASGGCVRFRGKFKFENLGTSATVLPSDGLFHRGTGALIDGVIANGVTDNVVVLEGSNFSAATNIVATDCTSIASVTNDTGADCINNSISNVVATSTYVGSTGGLFSIACFGAGGLKNTRFSNFNVLISGSAGGGGACIHSYKTSTGRVDGAVIDGLTLDYGSSVGILQQAVIIDGVDNVTVSNLNAKLETGGGTSAVRVSGDSVNALVVSGTIKGGTQGVYSTDTSEVRAQGVRLKGQGSYGIFADSTSNLTETGCRITGFGTSALNKGASATLRSQSPQSYTPIYSSDVGNAATTFTGTPTTTLARVSHTSDTQANLSFSFNSQLNAVTPAYLQFTLPAEIDPLDSNSWTPCLVYNGTAWETGSARGVTGSVVRIYRANLATFTSGAAVEARGNIDIDKA